MSASPPAAHQASAPASEPATNETKSSVGLQETLLGLIDPPQPPQDLFTPPPSSEAPPAEEVPPAPPVAATAPTDGEESMIGKSSMPPPLTRPQRTESMRTLVSREKERRGKRALAVHSVKKGGLVRRSMGSGKSSNQASLEVSPSFG